MNFSCNCLLGTVKINNNFNEIKLLVFDTSTKRSYDIYGPNAYTLYFQTTPKSIIKHVSVQDATKR